ncbi:MAG: hypothetical protein ACOX41_09315 [Anaerovoracaceae bacterium]|jgi:hypothetical protein
MFYNIPALAEKKPKISEIAKKSAKISENQKNPLAMAPQNRMEYD